MRWILVLQIIILGWLAKNYFDGAFNRSRHSNPSAEQTTPETPPSLESSPLNAPSFLSPLRAAFPPTARMRSRRLTHPAVRMQAQMEQMMQQANHAFADMDSFFGADAGWAALPPSPAVNMREGSDAYELSLALPDTDPASLNVTLEGRLLSIESSRDTQTAHASSSQRFHSRLLLPGPVDSEAPMQITNINNQIRIRISKPAATAARTP